MACLRAWIFLYSSSRRNQHLYAECPSKLRPPSSVDHGPHGHARSEKPTPTSSVTNQSAHLVVLFCSPGLDGDLWHHESCKSHYGGLKIVPPV